MTVMACGGSKLELEPTVAARCKQEIEQLEVGCDALSPLAFNRLTDDLRDCFGERAVVVCTRNFFGSSLYVGKSPQ